MSVDVTEVAKQLAKFARERAVIQGSLLSDAAKQRLLAQHDSVVAAYSAAVEDKPGDGGGTPQVPSPSSSKKG